MKLHEVHEDMDANNRRVFEMVGIGPSHLPLFQCVACGSPASIDESFSYQGHNLICRSFAEANGLLDPVDKVLEFVRTGKESAGD